MVETELHADRVAVDRQRDHAPRVLPDRPPVRPVLQSMLYAVHGVMSHTLCTDATDSSGKCRGKRRAVQWKALCKSWQPAWAYSCHKTHYTCSLKFTCRRLDTKRRLVYARLQLKRLEIIIGMETHLHIALSAMRSEGSLSRPEYMLVTHRG